ncbi:hypothetical protein [Modestobacter altitudinis]|nr:hypothetical protein [Modestobacter altitudinis]
MAVTRRVRALIDAGVRTSTVRSVDCTFAGQLVGSWRSTASSSDRC